MIGRSVVIGVLLVAAAAIQTAMLPLVSVGGYRPDLLLLLVIAFAVDDGPEVGVRIGFVAGLLTDALLATSAIGVSALVMAVVGYAIGSLRRFLSPNSLTAPLLLCFGGSIVATVALGAMAQVLGDAVNSLSLLLTAALVVGVSHTILLPVVLRLTRGIASRFPVEGAAAQR